MMNLRELEGILRKTCNLSGTNRLLIVLGMSAIQGNQESSSFQSTRPTQPEIHKPTGRKTQQQEEVQAVEASLPQPVPFALQDWSPNGKRSDTIG